jgi:hypothetical protein
VNILKSTALWCLAIVAVYLLFPAQGLFKDPEDISTRRFCAYGHVYVEFERNGHVWGTTFLSPSGKPVHCDDGEEVKETVKEII